MFIDAFKLITAEMFPSIVEWTRTKTIGEVWKMLRGPKLDFLKTKLELIFPKVLGRAMRKLSNVPSKAPILTEAVLFREALRILDPSDAKIAGSLPPRKKGLSGLRPTSRRLLKAECCKRAGSASIP